MKISDKDGRRLDLNECTICHGSSGLIKIRNIFSPHNHKSYTLYYCKQCKSQLFDVNEHPKPNEEIFYDAIALDRAYASVNFNPTPYWHHQVAFIQNNLRKPVQSILDLGCRTGDFLLHWPGGIKRVGIEISDISANIAQKRGLTVYQNRVEELYDLGRFDVVSCFAILEHLNNPEKLMARFEDLISDNGMLVILVPGYQSLKSRILYTLNIRWHMYSPPEHICLFSREYLDRYLGEHGFVLKARRYTSGGMFNPFRAVPILGRAF